MVREQDMMTDPIADMLTRIRNAIAVRKDEVVLPYSKLKFAIAVILQKEGYLARVERLRAKTGTGEELKVALKYDAGRQNAIRTITRISKPGRRMYVGYRDLAGVSKHRGLTILSTPKGVMGSSEAKKQKLGGEIICEIY